MEASWRAGLYLRLSREDEGGGESGSIGSQRSILRRFAAEQGMELAGEYVDDGYSGTSFDRPGFRRLQADIERGLINCVLVKDLSRLGRNSARTADLLDEYFPAHGVRFVAVVEGFDSLEPERGLALAAPLMMAVHEMYARDTSGKIRAALAAKRLRGDYVGSFAPFGYRKDPQNKNRLLPDEPAAAIVRELFEGAAAGVSPRELAAALNRRGVATPLDYRRRGTLTAGEGRWSASGVCKLLRNEVYLGCTQQGKSRKLSFKSKNLRPVPRRDWVTVPGTHEPLISRTLFARARDRCIPRGNGKGAGLFRGLAFCADCGSHLVSAGRGMLCCGGYKQHGRGFCAPHRIRGEALAELTRAALAARFGAAPPLERALLLTYIERLELTAEGEVRLRWLL